MKENFYFGVGIAAAAVAIVLMVLDGFNIWTFPFVWVVIVVLGIIFSICSSIGNNMENQKVSLFQLLVLVACADGEASVEEMQIIMEYAKQFGISGKRFNAIVENVDKGKVQFVVPDKLEEKEKNVRALVKMAKADGNIDAKELTLIKEVAKRYGLSESFVDNLV